jgi:hypothetical protein
MTSIAQVQAESAGADREPAAGLLDRGLLLLDRLPGPAIVAATVAAALVIVGVNAPPWIAGAAPWGSFDPETIVPAVAFAYSLWMILFLNRVAASAYAQFTPALDNELDRRVERARSALFSLPDLPALVTVITFEVVIIGGYLSNSQDPGTARGISPMLFAEYVLALAAVAVLVLHTVRQLRAVNVLHRLAANVDPLQPGPINALARLTSATAIGIVIVGLTFVVPTPGDPTTDQYEVGLAGVLMALAICCFALPLRGLHDRLADEKGALVRDATARIKSALERIHDEADRGGVAHAEPLQAQLLSLIAERDLYAKVSTWPWSAGTFRGFASALLLPVAIFMITQVIARFL